MRALGTLRLASFGFALGVFVPGALGQLLGIGGIDNLDPISCGLALAFGSAFTGELLQLPPVALADLVISCLCLLGSYLR